MKKVTGLDIKLIPLNDNETPAAPTFLLCFKQALGTGKAKTADEARIATRAIAKLRGKEADIELSDEEFKVLMDRVSQNTFEFYVWVQGQLLEKLDSAHA